MKLNRLKDIAESIGDKTVCEYAFLWQEDQITIRCGRMRAVCNVYARPSQRCGLYYVFRRYNRLHNAWLKER